MIVYRITMPVRDGSKAYLNGIRGEPIAFSSATAARCYLREKLGVSDEEIERQKINIEPIKKEEEEGNVQHSA